ncbi:MAG: hypothetical protein AAB449_03015 [Patescibacteria group bacterium]
MEMLVVKPRAVKIRVGKKARQHIEQVLRRNNEMRMRRGALFQDFSDNGRGPGEIFYANMKKEEFEALPLRCKRDGGPARLLSIFGELYSERYKDKESIAVYLHTYELDVLGIEY